MVIVLLCVCLCAVRGAIPIGYAAEDNMFWNKSLIMSDEAQRGEELHYSIVKSGDLTPHISAMAVIVANRSGAVEIHPAGEGKVTDVLVLPGQRVRKGQTLLVYTDHSLHGIHLEREQAQARLENEQAHLRDARFLYQRGLALLGQSVSAGELSRRRALVDEAESNVRSDVAGIHMIEHRLEDEFTSPTEHIIHDETSSLISPVEGTVHEINTAIHDDITPNDCVVSVTDTSTVWAIAFVRQEDIPLISLGSKMILSLPLYGKNYSLPAFVKTIESVVDPQTGLVRVMATLHDDMHQLRPGMQVDATLFSAHSVHGLIVPAAAIQDVAGHSLLYTRKGDHEFQPHLVVPSLEVDDDVLVQGDIQAGERVVSQGSFSLKAIASSSAREGE